VTAVYIIGAVIGYLVMGGATVASLDEMHPKWDDTEPRPVVVVVWPLVVLAGVATLFYRLGLYPVRLGTAVVRRLAAARRPTIPTARALPPKETP
jgi:hypothetical protein